MSGPRAAALLALAVLLGYANSLGNGFVWDDAVFIVEKSLFYGDPRNIPSALVSPHGSVLAPTSYYRPVVALACFVDELLFGGRPLGYRIESLVLHFAVTFLFWRLVSRSLEASGLALIAALLFAVHPVNTEAVNFLSARSDLLSTLFALVCLNLLATERLRGLPVALALFAYALALLSKESSIGLPAFVLFWWWPDVTRGRRAVALLGLLGITAAYLALRLAVLGALADGAGFGGLSLPLMVLYEDLRLVFLPFGLSAYHVVDPTLDWARALAVLAALGGLAATALLAPSPLRWASAWILVTLAPVSNVVPFQSAPVAERYLYPTALGAALMVGYGLHRLMLRSRVAGLAAVALVLLILLLQTVTRNPAWESDETLARSMLETQPTNATARVLLGTALRRNGRYDEALAEYRVALRLEPANARVHTNMGNVYLETRRFGKALESFETALRLKPTMVRLHFQIATAADAAGDREKAAAHYARFVAETKHVREARTVTLKRRARQRLRAFQSAGAPGDG